jgi:hypothetical protein
VTAVGPSRVADGAWLIPAAVDAEFHATKPFGPQNRPAGPHRSVMAQHRRANTPATLPRRTRMQNTTAMSAHGVKAATAAATAVARLPSLLDPPRAPAPSTWRRGGGRRASRTACRGRSCCLTRAIRQKGPPACAVIARSRCAVGTTRYSAGEDDAGRPPVTSVSCRGAAETRRRWRRRA